MDDNSLMGNKLSRIGVWLKLLEGSRAFLQSSDFTTLPLPPNQVLGVCWNNEANQRAHDSWSLPFPFRILLNFNVVTLNAAGLNDDCGAGGDKELAVLAVNNHLKLLERSWVFLQSSSFTTLSPGFSWNKERNGRVDSSLCQRIILINDNKLFFKFFNGG
jgi:hypothetical protein